MKHISWKRNLALFAAAVFAVGAVGSSAVFAISGSESGSREKRESTGDSQELRKQARELVDEKREKLETKQQKSLEQKQKACEDRATKLNKKIANYGRNAEKHLGVFDKIYDRADDYQERKQLAVDNYASLKAETDASKTAATEAVAALKALSVEVDCTAGDPATAVADVKAAVKNARDALHNYRVAIKDLVVALNTAKEVR